MTKPLSVREIWSNSIDAQRTVYRGISMRSKLEAEFARYLDSHGFEGWAYEPRIFGPVGQGYMPDFHILDQGRSCYIEVKPTVSLASEAKARMETIWRDEPDAILLAVSGDGWWQSAIRGHTWESWRGRWHGFRAQP